MNDTKLVESSIIIKRGGEEVEVYIDGYVRFHVERDYGADADGRRGISKTMVDDVSDLMAHTTEGEDFELTDLEKECAENILTMKFLD